VIPLAPKLHLMEEHPQTFALHDVLAEHLQQMVCALYDTTHTSRPA
jgi:hypothetical protein